jgi:hypothetical protein
MTSVSSLSDSDLIARLPALVGAERNAMADVIEHLAEVERRRLYLEHATSSLYRYCIERLGYSEDAAPNATGWHGSRFASRECWRSSELARFI